MAVTACMLLVHGILLLYCKVVANYNVSASPKSYVAIIGSDVIFNCTVVEPWSGSLDIAWFSGSIRVPQDGYHGYQVLEDGTSELVLSDVTLNDSGWYTCCLVEDDKKCGTSRVDVQLQVGLPPAQVSGLTCFSHSRAWGYCQWNDSNSHLVTSHTLQRCKVSKFKDSKCTIDWEEPCLQQIKSCLQEKPEGSTYMDNVYYVENENRDTHHYRVVSHNRLGTSYTHMTNPKWFSIYWDAVPLPPTHISLEAKSIDTIQVAWKPPPGFDVLLFGGQTCTVVGYRIRYKKNIDEAMWQKISVNREDLCKPSCHIDNLQPPNSEVCLQISSEIYTVNLGREGGWSEWSKMKCIRLVDEESTTVYKSTHSETMEAISDANEHSPAEISQAIQQIITPKKARGNSLIVALTAVVGVIVVVSFVICWQGCKKICEQRLVDYEVKIPSIVHRSIYKTDTIQTRFRVQEREEFDEICTQKPDRGNCTEAGINLEQNQSVVVPLLQRSTGAADIDPLLDPFVSITATENGMGNHGDRESKDDVVVYAGDDGDAAKYAAYDDDYRDQICYFTMTCQGSLVQCDKTKHNTNKNTNDQLAQPWNKEIDILNCKKSPLTHDGQVVETDCEGDFNTSNNEADKDIHTIEPNKETCQESSSEVDAYVQQSQLSHCPLTCHETSSEVDAYVQQSQVFSFCNGKTYKTKPCPSFP